MIAIVLIVFGVLLLIGMPVAFVVLGAAGVGILGDGFAATIIAQQTVGGINNFTLLAVPFFIIAGDLAAKGRTSQKIIDTINAFLGHIPGGLGIAAVAASAFFGAITGSAIATVVAVGALMLPKLLEAGYPRSLSLGIIACAGTLGVMIPPSIPMLTMAVALQTSVSAQFLAGILPGLLMALLMCLYVAFAAKRLKVPRTDRVPWRQRLHIVKESIWAILFPVIVLGSIYSGFATPTEAAVISAIYVIIIELFIYREMDLKSLYQLLGPSIVSAATMSVLLATAQTFLWYLTSAHVPEMILSAIQSAITSPISLLLLLCLVFLIAGCFMNVGSVVIILAPVLLVLLQSYGINTYQFIIIATMMNQIGFITPPFGLCLFVTMKVGRANMKEVIVGSVPFMICMTVVTALLIAIPQISTILPTLFG